MRRFPFDKAAVLKAAMEPLSESKSRNRFEKASEKSSLGAVGRNVPERSPFHETHEETRPKET